MPRSLWNSKSGANGSIAAEDVARAEPDGYTWLLVTTFFTTSPSLNLVMRWDPVRDFTPIGMICQAPNVFIVPASLPVKNVAEFIALAKAKPGALNYGHPGKGSTGHLGFELFKRLAGIDVNPIGYRGYPQMVADIASGLLTSSFFSTNQALSLTQSGTIRIIASIGEGRSKYFPDVPTMAEQGFAEAQVTPWFGIVVPSKTPQPIVDENQRGIGGGGGRARGARKARFSGLYGEKCPARRICRHHQVRYCAVGQGRQGRRHSRGLSRRKTGGRRVSPGPPNRRIRGHFPEQIAALRAFATMFRRIQSVSFSIGQLTFGSFTLLLAMIAMTSIASVVAIRHIDATFAELQHLQSLGDVAEEIDRRTKELRLAARDFVTDPAAPSGRVQEAASSLSALLKNTRLQLAPEQQEMIDGVTQRLSNYQAGMDRITALISRRAELVSALPPVRARFEQAIADIPETGHRTPAVSRTKSAHGGAVGARSGRSRAVGRAP